MYTDSIKRQTRRRGSTAVLNNGRPRPKAPSEATRGRQAAAGWLRSVEMGRGGLVCVFCVLMC